MSPPNLRHFPNFQMWLPQLRPCTGDEVESMLICSRALGVAFSQPSELVSPVSLPWRKPLLHPLLLGRDSKRENVYCGSFGHRKLSARHSQTHFCCSAPLMFAGLPSFVPNFCLFSSHFWWVSIIFRHPVKQNPAGPPNSRLGREISENLFEASEAVTDLEGQQPPGRKSLLF